MIPFLNFGPPTIPACVLTVAAGLLAAAWILQADFNRSRTQFVKSGPTKSAANPSQHYEGLLVAGVTGFAVLVGARLNYVLESPRELLADPSVLIGWFGFAWFGGLLGGLLAALFLAQRFGIPALEFLDRCSPAAAVGYAISRLGCSLSGDGDYAVTTQLVHLLPLYEFFIGLAIAAFLWHLGTKALRGPKAQAEIFCNYLLLNGIARFTIESIRGNPHSFFDLLYAQKASLASILAGAALLWRIKSQFHGLKKEHRIVEHIVARGDVLQPEYHRPTPECPHPERWHMYDSMTAEVEVLDFLKALVTTVKPELVVETGTFSGLSTLSIAQGLKANGFGRVITCELDPKVYAAAKQRFDSSELGQWIDARNESSLEMNVEGRIDFLFSDSDAPLREQEVRKFLTRMNPNGVILMHDASSSMKTVREAALRLEAEGLISVLLLPTPRGLVIAQKREGRS